MAVNYKKLWKILINGHMKKKDLYAVTTVSYASMAKLERDNNVMADVLVRTCGTLSYNIVRIIEIMDEKQKRGCTLCRVK